VRRNRRASLALMISVGLAWLAVAAASALCGPAADDNPSRDVRIKKFPVAVQCWTFRNFSFFETLAKVRELGVRYVQAYPDQPLGAEAPGVLFNQDLTDAQINLVRRKLEETGLSLSGYGVVTFENTEAAIRRVFDFARKLDIPVIITEPQAENADLLDRLAGEYSLFIAIHNHPEPSAFAKPETVLSYVLDRSENFGSCFDDGHFMRGGHKPIECLRILQGRVWDVHIKDRSGYGTEGVEDVSLGDGQADIRGMLAELTLQDYPGWLTIEHEADKDVGNPTPAVRKSLDYLRSITYYEDYRELLSHDLGGFEKHGWNHYGPGYFELDSRSGVLESRGGMGLLWYSARRYKDFVLELDYMCSDAETNSGIFLRVPEVPTSDDYIYHSFEIQIYDAGQGIHKTGAVYDAEPPRLDAQEPTGEWNHLKVTFQGRRLRVELNGREVVDWQAEPRGKVKDFATEGYIGLQNHDSLSPVYFKEIQVRELK
jgi:sugar phosphate isomerase/epimerase